MKKAKRNTTELPSALSGLESDRKVRVPKQFVTGENAFSLYGSGDCLEPLISDGDWVVCDPNRKPEAFDLVAIAFKSGNWWVKRYRHAPDDFAKEHIVVEQINPPKFFKVPLDRIEGIFVVTYNVTKQKGLLDLPLPEWIHIPVVGTIGDEVQP